MSILSADVPPSRTDQVSCLSQGLRGATGQEAKAEGDEEDRADGRVCTETRSVDFLLQRSGLSYLSGAGYSLLAL